MIRILIAGLMALALEGGQAPDAAAEAERARQLVVAGRPEDAVPIYKRLAAAYSGNAGVLIDLSIAEFQAKLYRAAIEDALAALTIEPDLAPANLFLGASYLKLDEPAEALDPLEKAANAAPKDQNAHLMRAEALLGTRRFGKALVSFRDLSGMLPDNPQIWYGLGQTYEGLAQEAAGALEAKSPKSSYWLLLAADSFRRQHKLGSAFATYREALANGPLIPGIHEGSARVYKETGHADWAVQEMASELTVPSLKSTVSGPASDFQAYKTNTELAAKAYDNLMALLPSLESHLHRAKTLSAEGQHRQAAGEWRETFNISPESPSIRLGLAQSLYACRDSQAVLPVLAPYLEQATQSAQANFLYGAALIQLDRPGEAVAYLRAALHRDQHFSAANAALGQALLLSGKPDEAIGYLKEASAADQDANVSFQLFRAYQLTGNKPLAKGALAYYQNRRASLDEQRSREDGSRVTRPEK